MGAYSSVSHASSNISCITRLSDCMMFDTAVTMYKTVWMMKYRIVTLMTHFIVVDTGGIGCASIDTLVRSVAATSFPQTIIFETCIFVAKRAWSVPMTHWSSPWAQS